jgi:hypothetical protein
VTGGWTDRLPTYGDATAAWAMFGSLRLAVWSTSASWFWQVEARDLAYLDDDGTVVAVSGNVVIPSIDAAKQGAETAAREYAASIRAALPSPAPVSEPTGDPRPFVRPVSVGEALEGSHVIEFFDGVDWFQVKHAIGERNPRHRWRHVRAVGWAGWRGSSKAMIDRWSRLPCKLVEVADADDDPALRWPVDYADKRALALGARPPTKETT